MALYRYVDDILKTTIVCNKNIEVGEHLGVYFLIDIYIYNLKSTQHIEIYVTNTCIYVHISKYILAQD